MVPCRCLRERTVRGSPSDSGEAHEDRGRRHGVRGAGRRAPVSPRAATTSSAWTRTRPRSGCCAAARARSTSRASRSCCAATRPRGRLSFTTDLAKAVRQSTDHLHRRRHAAGRGRLGRPAARAGRGPRHRHGDERLQGHRRQEHGAGRHRRTVREVIRRETTHPFSVVSNPEFLKQGAAVDDFMKPDRVVIGAEDPKAAELMVALHKPFTRTGAPIMVMDCASAELCEVRRQRHAGHQDLVHERDRQRLRGATAPTSTRCARRWAPTAASGRRSCSPASATAAAASRRTSRRSSSSRPTRSTTSRS